MVSRRKAVGLPHGVLFTLGLKSDELAEIVEIFPRVFTIPLVILLKDIQLSRYLLGRTACFADKGGQLPSQRLATFFARTVYMIFQTF